MFVASNIRRSRAAPVIGGLEITIPSRAGLMTAFMGVWLAGWVFGEIFALQQLLSGSASGESRGFLTIWLLAWTAGGAWALTTFLWSLIGRERIVATRDELIVIRELGPWRRVQRFAPSEVKAIRVIDVPTGLESFGRPPTVPFWGIGAGPIAFDYGYQTFRVGGGISAAEARIILEEIAAHTRLQGGRPGAPSLGVPA